MQQALIVTAITFLNTRLTGKARVGLPTNLATIDEWINDVELWCKDKQTPESSTLKITDRRIVPENSKFDAIKN